MISFSLQSGSNGNSIYVEAANVRLLFDAGIGAEVARSRLAQHGRDIRACDALIISHEHEDHVRGAATFQRRYRLPIYATRPTLHAARVLGRLPEVHTFHAGSPLRFGEVTVHTIPTPHDAVDGVAFVVECAGKRLGILTDLGHPFPALEAVLGEVDAAYLESNYDPELLERGRYPEFLKERIRGDGGHLSNEESARLSERGARRRLVWVAVAHLSAENNEPALAVEAHRRTVGRSFPVHVAPRHEVGPLLEV